MARIRTLAALAVLSIAVLTGCSATATTTPADPEETSAVEEVEEQQEEAAALDLPDACSLITTAELEQITGIAFAEGEHFTEGETDVQSICDYYPVDGFFPFVQILVNTAYTDLEAQRDAAVAGTGGAAADVDVAGGEFGYTVDGGTILGVGIKGYFVQVSLYDEQGSDQTAVLVPLAEAVGAAL